MKNKIIAIVVFLIGFIGVFNINFGDFKEYRTHHNIEFIINHKIEKAPAYKYSGELGFICINKNDNKQYYIIVNEITYYNNNVGDIVRFNLSQYDLDFYSGYNESTTKVFGDILLTLFVIISLTITITSLVGFKNTLSKFEKYVYKFNLIYIILSLINFVYIIMVC